MTFVRPYNKEIEVTGDTPQVPLAFLNGREIDAADACLPVSDLGLVHGAAVTEMVRTFRHRCFRLPQHLDRLGRSLCGIGVEIPYSLVELGEIAERIVAHNANLLEKDADLGLVLFVTAGQNPTYLGPSRREECARPTVCVHTFPLPFELWAHRYQTGVKLVVPEIRQLPEFMDATIKSRSRLHWFLADQQARKIDPASQALLLDQAGNVTETSSGNVFAVRDGELWTPGEHVLEGISRQYVLELAQELEIPARIGPFDIDAILTANEVFTTSTPTCLLPVTSVNGKPIGSGSPGPIFTRLIATWSQQVGLDIVRQMQAGAAR